MKAWIWIRIVFAVTFAIFLTADIDRISKGEDKKSNSEKEPPRYRPYLSAYIMPLYVLMVAILLMMQRNWYVIRDTVFCLFGIFLHISAYYVVLMVLLPHLRKRFSSRVCALLWILPNYLYVFTNMDMDLSMPLWIIPLPDVSPKLLCTIWLTGFVAVLGWKWISHLRFRRMLRKSAQPVTDVTMLRLWGEAQIHAGIVKSGDPKTRYIPLVWSEKVNTPLAVGLIRPCMDMVMPMRSYSEEELAMIFRHEVIHIGREDSWTKFLLVFCTAMCWFNPLMWVAMRRCAEDVELSCDETVLLNAEEKKKKQYAQLLLKTAGDDRGFTTCLSATGQAMRYRLKQVMDAPKKSLGLLLAAGTVVLLFMTCGSLTFAYDYGTVTELIMEEDSAAQLMVVYTDLVPEEVGAMSVEKELYQYLSQLQVHRRTGSYTDDESTHTVTMRYDRPNVKMTLSDRRLSVFYFSPNAREERYYLEEPVDWAILEEILTQP